MSGEIADRRPAVEVGRFNACTEQSQVEKGEVEKCKRLTSVSLQTAGAGDAGGR
jgi:hypothetical protein